MEAGRDEAAAHGPAGGSRSVARSAVVDEDLPAGRDVRALRVHGGDLGPGAIWAT